MNTIYEVKFKVPSLDKIVTLKSTKKVFDLNNPDDIEMFYVNENSIKRLKPEISESLKPQISESLKPEIEELLKILEKIKKNFPDLENNINELTERNTFFKTETNALDSVFK